MKIKEKAIYMKCVWCGRTGPAKFHEKVKWENLNSKWYRCNFCDSLMILPRPSDKLIKTVYENSYRNKRLQPHPAVDNRIRYSKKYQPVVFDEYKKSLEDLGVLKGGVKSVLDFGCADGIFLKFCKNYFNSSTILYGTDLSEEMLYDARMNGFNTVALTDLGKLNTRFDLITLWDVIEHLQNPDEVIRTLKKLLRAKGKILIQTPRFGDLAELLGPSWSHLLPVQHLSLASKEGMKKFAGRIGLRVETHTSFSANAPSAYVNQPYKAAFDKLAKKLDFGGVQLVILVKDE